MFKLYATLILVSFLCLGCADADINAKADVDTDINTQIETFMKAHLESLIKVQLDTKVQGIGVDIKNKIADEIKASITADIKSHIDSKIEANTHNQGMFSGGAIYVVIVVITFFVFVFGTFIWVVKALMKWKKIWTLLSSSISEHSEDKNIKKIKSHFSKALEVAGLKTTVDKNLKKRGI